MKAHQVIAKFTFLIFVFFSVAIVFSQEEEELRKRRQELEERKRALEQERYEALARKNEQRRDRAYKIDVSSLTQRVSASEFMLFSGAEITFPQSPLVDNYKGKVLIDVFRFGYFPDIHLPVGFHLQFTTGSLSRETLKKQANNPPTYEEFRFANRLNTTQIILGAKFLQSYSQSIIQPFASADLMLGMMSNIKFAQLLDENGKPLEDELAFTERIGKTSTFWGFKGRAGFEISINKLFNRQDEHYRGEGFFFSASLGFSRSFSDNVIFLDSPEDFDPLTFDSEIYEALEMNKIGHIVQARKNATFWEAYSLHFGIIYRGFSF